MPHIAKAPPSRPAALARIGRIKPEAYARTRNHLDGAVTGLSPYLTHGLITLPEVLAGVLREQALPVQHKLVFELGWREFFRHVWAHEGDRILQSFHPGPLPDDAYARSLPADIRQACTGVPAIDQAVRQLYATGGLHNHARMWLASYVVHLRHVHWRIGADWMVAHLLDGDLASNHLSWQWVAGTGSTKPYVFNADNVARFAPAAWHSPHTVLDQSYEALGRIASGAQAGAQALTAACARELAPTAEPVLHGAPPAPLHVHIGTAESVARLAARLAGRDVWLVHPWCLRAPPASVSSQPVLIGVYPQEVHAQWPWPAMRWHWVDEAMADLTAEHGSQSWLITRDHLSVALAAAMRVQTVADPHISPWLPPQVQTLDAPVLFKPVAQRCSSFSAWWTRVTRDVRLAAELL
jgi:deoxyribodipyrimidine photo-lyase